MTLDTRSPAPVYNAEVAVPDAPATPPARVFYRIDSGGVSLAEHWRSRPSGIVTQALCKLFRAKLPSSIDDAAVESLAAFEVEKGDVPGAILQRSSMPLSQLAGLGFGTPIWHVVVDDVNQTTTYLATMPHSSGRTWARVHHRIWKALTPAKQTMFTELVSELVDGTFLWSISSKPDVGGPTTCTILRDVGAPPGKLLAAHDSALRLMDLTRVRTVASPAELRGSIERHHVTVRDRHLRRKLFVPLSADERQAATEFRTSVKTAEQIGSRYPEILAEVARIQNAKASKSNGVVLLLVSIALFFGAGLTGTGGGFSLGTLLILVGVLFVHEMGHWVAMRTFGYRNMKMFFIPFFGAAVSGRHYNVPGWKKAVVSLMGPLPGIAIGAGLGVLAISVQSALLTKIALVALLLNGFNLLPILPLDGGWVVQSILFSRHHILELAFRIVALLALVVLGALMQNRVLGFVAISMGVSLITMYKLARITNELRRERLPAVSDDGQTIPPATAEVIVGKLKAALPAKLSNRGAATFTLQIFENLNARPPGFFASLALGVVQFGSIAFVVVAAGLLYLRSHDGVWHDLTPASISVLRTPGDSALAAPRNLVVADFPSAEKATAAVAALRGSGSPEVGIERFGQSIFVALPFEDVSGLREIQTAFAGLGTSASYVATPGDQATVRLQCTAPSPAAALALQRELDGYLSGDGLHLVAPWQPGLAWTADERAHFARARATFHAVVKALARADADPQAFALQKKIGRANLAQDEEEMRRLEIERDALAPRLRAEALASVRRDPANDTLVIDSLSAIESSQDREAAIARGMASVAPLLGQLPLVDGAVSPAVDAWTASGSVVVKGAKVSLTMKYTNAFVGAPPVVRWLATNRCGDMKYNLVAGAVRKPRELEPEAALSP